MRMRTISRNIAIHGVERVMRRIKVARMTGDKEGLATLQAQLKRAAAHGDYWGSSKEKRIGRTPAGRRGIW